MPLPPFMLLLQMHTLKKVFSDKYLISFLWHVAAVLSFWAFGYTRVQDSDLWWHLANGRWIWDHHAVPLKDFWSFTAYGKAWVNDAWLSGLIYFVWSKIAGLYSLAWWKWIVVICTFLFLMRTLYRMSGDWIASYLAVLLSIAIAAPFLDLRPQLFSFLSFVILLACIVHRPKPSAFLPVLLLLWSNLHAVVYFGLAALTILLLGDFSRSSPLERRRLVILWVCCILACTITPNGPGTMVRPFRYASSSTLFTSIKEWHPPFEAGWVWTVSPLYPFAIALFIVSAVILLHQDFRQKLYSRHLGHLLLGALTLAMSLKSRRFIPLFAIAQTLTVSAVLARLLIFVPLRQTVFPAVIAVALGIALILPYPASSYAFPYLVQEANFPVETCNFIEYNNLSGKVFAYYTFGSYVTFRTNGRMRVYIDGRADMVYDDETYRRYLTVLYQQEGWFGTIEASDADFVLWPKGRDTVPDQLLNTGEWYLLYEDSVSALLTRITRAGLNNLRETQLSGWKELAVGTKYMNIGEFALAEKHYNTALELMPYIDAPCKGLADAQFLQGKTDLSQKTIARCFEFYPPPGMDNPVSRALTAVLPLIKK